MRPLEGITVLALEQAVAAPLATRHLADMGARIIKIERPESGDFARHYDTAVNGLSSHFVWLNRTKESITLDLKHSSAQEIVRVLLKNADVFIQNLAPGATDRLGLSSETLSDEFPALVICSISGFGSTGPYRDHKAYDLLIQAETGFLSISGTKDTPVKAGIAVADIAAGMYALNGILAALFKRARTGQGCILDVSLFDALSEWMGYPYFYTYSGRAPERTGAHHATIAPYGPFRAADGKSIFLSIQNDLEWVRFCSVLGLDIAAEPRFATNPQRVEHRDELQRLIEAKLANDSIPSSELTQRLTEAKIANGKQRDIKEALEHPQLLERNRYWDISSPVGNIRALIPPVNFSDSEPAKGPIPLLGEHSESILREIGLSEAEIDRLQESKVI